MIFKHVYLFGTEVSSLYFFLILGLVFFIFTVWKEGRKDGFNTGRMFDMSLLSLLTGGVVFQALSEIFNWLSLYRPHNFLLHYDTQLTLVFITYIGSLVPVIMLSRKWKWSLFRILDIFSVAHACLLFFLSFGCYLIYEEFPYIIFALLILLASISVLRLRGYKFYSGFIFSFFTAFLGLTLLLLFRRMGYLLFSTLFFATGIINLVLRKKEGMFKNTLTKGVLEKVREKLRRKEKRLEQEELLLKSEDPYLRPGRTEDNAEAMDEAILEDVAKGIIDARISMAKRAKLQVRKALAAMKIGKYGKCEVCENSIDKARLAAYPETTTCLECSKKKSRQV